MSPPTPFSRFARFVYFLVAGLACFTVVHAVGIAGMHNWSREILCIPIGLLLGWLELALFSAVGIASFFLAAKSYMRLLKNAN